MVIVERPHSASYDRNTYDMHNHNTFLTGKSGLLA